ncbi:MAG: NADH-quinone oxidoreductase subunit J [Gammaproteobacteria bacterium]|nr:NADH-quinone oxidoreductase subunit J [Gammaproteobacteria bacterium]
MFQGILFYWIAFVVVVAALGVISARNPIHSVMFLVLAFVSSAVLWMLLEAEFLAIVLVLVYVGAVMVLFLFVVMMLDINVQRLREGLTRYAPLGIGVAVVVILEIAHVVWFKAQGFNLGVVPQPAPADYSNTEALGAVLYTEYVYPLELAAVLLLVAIIAAIALTMRRRPGLKKQNIARQVAVRAEDRVRLVKMKTEKDQ